MKFLPESPGFHQRSTFTEPQRNYNQKSTFTEVQRNEMHVVSNFFRETHKNKKPLSPHYYAHIN